MKTRSISFQQVMIIPALTTLGLGSLLYAQNLSWSTPVNAQTLPAGDANPALVLDALVPKASVPHRAPVALKTPAPRRVAPSMASNPEFGGTVDSPTQNDQIRATTKTDLVRMARESSGREDPFVALINPDPSLVQPLPEAVRPVKVIPSRLLVQPHPIKVATRVGEQPVVIDPPQEGDEPARGPLVVPKWSLSGVLNTGHEEMALLELNGDTREARLGEVLEDGSRVVHIESNRVVLMLNGRRFPKTIGGADLANE